MRGATTPGPGYNFEEFDNTREAMAKTSRLKTVALILAGGKGSRLKELTRRRAKPVVPFGGTYRLIDIPLSNLHHSGLSEVWVVEQFRPHGLNEHLRNGRPWDLDRTQGGLLVMPPFSPTRRTRTALPAATPRR